MPTSGNAPNIARSAVGGLGTAERTHIAARGVPDPRPSDEAVKPEHPQEPDHLALFGRDRELAMLGELLDELLDGGAGRGRALLLIGDPGVGKSMLLHAVEHLAVVRGVRVLKAT